MANLNLTSELVSKYSDVSVSDEVCYGLCSDVDDNDNFVGKIFEANYDAACVFYDVFDSHPITRKVFDLTHRNCLDELTAINFINILNSEEIIDDYNHHDVLVLRILMNDLSSLVGPVDAIMIAAGFNPDNV